MKTLALALSIAGLGVAADIHGQYVEARTADIYTGPCFSNSEVELTGNLAVLGCGMIYRPDGPSQILALSAGTIRLIGIASLILLAGYVGWVSHRPRILGIGTLRIALPGRRSTLVQIGIGLADLGFSSLAMYSLTSATGGEAFPNVAVAFVSLPTIPKTSCAPSIARFAMGGNVNRPSAPPLPLLWPLPFLLSSPQGICFSLCPSRHHSETRRKKSVFEPHETGKT